MTRGQEKIQSPSFFLEKGDKSPKKVIILGDNLTCLWGHHLKPDGPVRCPLCESGIEKYCIGFPVCEKD
jgi:hypothetical protein